MSATVVAVVSPKGGTGKTVVAVNLAAAFAAHYPTALIDLDLGNGDVEYALRLHPAHRFEDFARRATDVPELDLNMLLTPARDRLGVVCASQDPQTASTIDNAQSAAVIANLRAQGQPIVIDTAPGFTPSGMLAIGVATHVALICTTDVAAVQAGQKLLRAAVSDGVAIGRMHLVINRSDSRCGLTPSDVAAVLGLPTWLEIPEHADLTATTNLGAPLRAIDPHSAISERFSRYAHRILGDSNGGDPKSAHHREQPIEKPRWWATGSARRSRTIAEM
jgi:pilus assembly protein CpaE